MEKENDPRDIQHEEMLNFSRQNMLDSLQLFFSHTKYSLTLLTTILAASLAITAFSFDKLLQDKPDASKLALVLAAVFLILMGPVSYITHRLIGALLPAVCVLLRLCRTIAREVLFSTEHP